MNAFSRAFIEPLEARIAPALFQTGLINHPASPTAGEIDYTDANGGAEDGFFVNTEADPNDPISALVGPGEPLVADTFYAKLRTTDLLKVFNNTGFQPLISGDVLGNAGITGNIVAFFVDKNLDNEVQLNELTGLALGNKVQAIISGSVDGDVVTNLNDQTGRIGGAAETIGTGTDLLQNKIADVNISGDVNGAVASGGEIKALKVNGQVNRVIAGTAANGYQYDFNSAAIADGGDTLNVAAPGAGVKGISIGKTTVGDLSLRTLPDGGQDGGIMQAGDGGPGAAGGSLTAITILADATGFVLQGGSGGAGTGSIAKGGAGGAIKNVIVNGLDIGSVDLTANSLMLIKSGVGGEGAASAPGGKGGVVQDVFVGFESVSGSGAPRRSVTAMSDEVVVQGGDGGAGLNGGKGGVAKNVSVFAAPTGSQNNIEVLGGVGGATKNSSGTAGVGGALTNITALNPSTDAEAENSKILLRGGDGGSTAAGGAGAKGGKIENADLIGFQHELRGGEGSAGTTGGNGGTLKDIVLTDGAESVRPQNVLLDGGVAGIGLNGKGGNGGKVKDVTILNSDLITLDINSTVLAADGAASKRGTGGKGGTVSNLFITELDTANPGIARIRGGNGGAGGDVAPAGGAGGKAGNVVDATIAAVSLDLTASGGNGGNATLNGKGGKAGILESLFFSSFQQDELPSGGVLTEVIATLSGGIGGNGAGSGAGGKGGDVKDSSVTVGRAVERLVGGIRSFEVDGGTVSVTGGKGGDSGNAGGKGGSVLKSTFTSFAGDVANVAGNAGAGTKVAKGGKVNDISIDVGNQVTVMGGAGTGGGAGGTINNIGFSRAVEDSDVVGTITATASPAPLGAVTIIAGDGSTAGPKAGAGGSVTDATGFVGITGMTTIQAGVGAASVSKAAKGGSIVDLSLFGGGGTGAELRIQAGNALNSANASVGGAGGDVKNVGIGINAFDVTVPENPANASAIHPDTIIRHIAAGNGGNTGSPGGRGGVGGSIIDLNTHVDIGLRDGEAFGYLTMGGLFAGSGGINSAVPHSPTTIDSRDGKAGSILGVTADAIASIVAGRPEMGAVITAQNMATKVDGVILNGLENPTFVDENGTYANIDTANLIGGVKDPAAVGVPYDPDNNPGTPQVLHPHANTFDETSDPETTEFVDNDNNDGFSLGDATTANTDGFVAAISYIDNLTNVRAEAVLTMVNGIPTFIDLNNLNGQRIRPTQPTP